MEESDLIPYRICMHDLEVIFGTGCVLSEARVWSLYELVSDQALGGLYLGISA